MSNRMRPRGSGLTGVFRDAPALVLSSGLTAVLTLGFWAAAGHLHDTATIGRASAEISAITLVAGIAQLNLLGVFLRFLPAAGHLARRFLLAGYVAILIAAVTGGCIFLATGLDQGFGGPGAILGRTALVAAIAAQALFIVQDGVLTALGKATWVPAENLVAAAARFGLLLLPVTAVGQLGIPAAWFIPVLAAVAAVSVLVFRKLAVELRNGAAGPSALPDRGDIARFIFAEYVNSLFMNAATFAPPLLVLHLVNPSAAAYFNLPWLIVMTMQTLLWNVVMPFIAQSSRLPDTARRLGRQTVAVGLLLVFVATPVLVVAAPLVLGLQGEGFAAAGAPLLRILALGIPFSAVMVLYSAIAVVRRRIWPMAGINAAAGMLFFGGLLWALPRYGIVGGGLVYLVVQVVLAAAVVAPIVRWFRASRALSDAPEVSGRPRDEVATSARGDRGGREP